MNSPPPTPGPSVYLYHSPWLGQEGSITLLRLIAGPWLHVYDAYNYCAGLAGLAVLFRTHLQGRRERASSLLFIAGSLLGVIADALYEFDLSPTPGLNYAPIILPITSGLIAVALLGHRMLDLAPVARSALMEDLGRPAHHRKSALQHRPDRGYGPSSAGSPSP